MVNVGRRAAPVSIDFSSSRNAASIERKVLQYTTSSVKLHLCTLSAKKTNLILSDILVCVLIHCADQKEHLNPDCLLKSIDNTLETCVDIANEYLQAYNTGADVKIHVCCSMHKCKCSGHAMFLITFVLSNLSFSKLKSIIIHSITVSAGVTERDRQLVQFF